jgi:ribosomal protein S18 acetylase RimI-like enzyme
MAISPRATRGATARRPAGEAVRVADLRLGWQSHLLACRFGAEVIERDDCVVLRTPDNPTYYWGNCLILPDVPRDGDVDRWLARFDDEIARRQPESRHVAIGVDASVLGHALPRWRAAGVDEFDDMAVLALEPAGLIDAPPPRVPTVELRRMQLDDELELAVEAQVAARDASFEAEGYRLFRRRSMQRVAAMHAAGIAQWYGAFVDGVLAADCGLVHDHRTARFQYVETQVAWRRRGLCRALVTAVCRDAFVRLGLARLVMCADPHDVAIDIYRAVGFEQLETFWCLQRRPRA